MTTLQKQLNEIDDDISSFHNGTDKAQWDLSCKYGCRGLKDYIVIDIMQGNRDYIIEQIGENNRGL